MGDPDAGQGTKARDVGGGLVDGNDEDGAAADARQPSPVFFSFAGSSGDNNYDRQGVEERMGAAWRPRHRPKEQLLPVSQMHICNPMSLRTPQRGHERPLDTPFCDWVLLACLLDH